jgi:LysM repeat protein
MFERRLTPNTCSGKIGRMGRTRVRRRRSLTIGVILVALLVTGPVSRAFAPRPAARAHRVYVVRAGDTVWAIASRFAGGGDPRPIVDAIDRRNRLRGGSIVPGQALVIPRVA